MSKPNSIIKAVTLDWARTEYFQSGLIKKLEAVAVLIKTDLWLGYCVAVIFFYSYDAYKIAPRDPNLSLHDRTK